MDLIKSIFVWLTGIFFLVVFFPLTFIIWLIVYPFDRKRAVVHKLLVWQSMLLVRLSPGLRVIIEGKEKAMKNETYVIIANHQSLLDILIINCLGYRFRWISKSENLKVPVLGWYLRMAGYIIVDRNDEDSKAEMLARSYRCLQDGTSIMIFPEGTRSTGNEPGFFKRGAFQLALEANVPVLPVIIDGTGDLLPAHGRIIKGNHIVRLRVLDPVSTHSIGTSDVIELGAYFRNLISVSLNDLKSGK